ncbi:MAG: MaoC family dehydratase [Candidatus Acidiferrales bacterium]
MTMRVVESVHGLKELVGREVGVSDWFVVTQERITQFAETIEDRQWIHVDRERAERESPYRTTIAHGFLTMSLLGHLMNQVIDVHGSRLSVNYGTNRVRFPAAVRAGSRIRARVALDSVRDVADSVEAVFSFTVECEGSDKPCCVAEWVLRFYPE